MLCGRGVCDICLRIVITFPVEDCERSDGAAIQYGHSRLRFDDLGVVCWNRRWVITHTYATPFSTTQSSLKSLGYHIDSPLHLKLLLQVSE